MCRYVKLLSVPFRQMYPDAPTSQWKCKGKDAEKFVRIMQLINPSVDPLEVCKVDEVVEEEEEEETFPGILNQINVRIVYKECIYNPLYFPAGLAPLREVVARKSCTVLHLPLECEIILLVKRFYTEYPKISISKCRVNFSQFPYFWYLPCIRLCGVRVSCSRHTEWWSWLGRTACHSRTWPGCWGRPSWTPAPFAGTSSVAILSTPSWKMWAASVYPDMSHTSLPAQGTLPRSSGESVNLLPLV